MRSKSTLKELADDGLIIGPRRKIREKGQLPPVTVIEIKGQDAEGDTYAAPVTWNEDEEGAAAAHPGAGEPGTARHHASRRWRPCAGPDRAPCATRPRSGYAYVARPIKVLPRAKGRELGVFRKAARGEGGGGIIHPIDKKALREWRVDSHNAGDAEDGELVRYEVVRQGGYRHGQGPRGRAPGQSRGSARGQPDRHPHPRAAAHISGHGASRARRSARARVAGPRGPARRSADHHRPRGRPRPRRRGVGGGRTPIQPIPAASWSSWPSPTWGIMCVRATRSTARRCCAGNSVYFPDRVVPMLPETLSNNLCSLKEQEDRPCLAVRMVFDASGHKTGHRFMRAMMRSSAKLAYKEAQAAIDGRGGDKANRLLTPVLQPLWAAYEALSKARDARGTAGPRPARAQDHSRRLRKDRGRLLRPSAWTPTA